MIPARIKYTGNTFNKNNNMRIVNFKCDVNTYIKIIFTVRIELFCNVCGELMIYHACYEVNYKSAEITTKIVILRYRCQKCKVTHSLKPEFLASRHQYDTFQRQKYVLQYSDISRENISLRKLSLKLFPEVLVSHTVMYYWVRILAAKKQIIESLLTKEIQEYQPSCDISSELLPEAEVIPNTTREKHYSKDTMKLINWGKIYIRITSIFRSNSISDYHINPFGYINRILDILTAHTFL